MASYVLVDEFGNIRARDDQPHDHPAGHPTWRWLEEVIIRSVFDPELEIETEPTVTITATQRIVEYPKRILTGPERAAIKQARVADFIANDHLVPTAILAIIEAMKAGVGSPEWGALPDDELELDAWLNTI
jgi:hypothetical protein